MVGNRGNRGFSLIELMVVVAIILVVAVVAIPNVITGLAAVRLRSAASSFSGLMQDARMMAVRDNRTYAVATVTNAAGESYAFVDRDLDGAFDDNERTSAILLPQGVGFASTGAPSISTLAIPNYSPTAALPSFNSRGLPCSGSPCANGAFIFYIRQTRSLGGDAWGAVTITQAGRIKSWNWTGARWN